MFSLVNKYRRLYILTVLLMFISFTLNVFGVGTGNWFNNFQKDSELLVVNKIACQQELGQDVYGGMLVVVKDHKEVSTSERHPICQKDYMESYKSQYGLQGKINATAYLVVHKVANVSVARFLVLAQFFWALLTALTLGLFVVWVAAEFSVFTAVFTAVLLSLSIWIVGFARNLYWVTPLLFLPLVFTLFYYKRPQINKGYALFLGGLFVLFLLRFLNGYEFTPEVILAPVAALGYLVYKHDASLVRLAKEGMVICVVGGLAFLCAFGANYYQIYKQVGDSSRAFGLIEERAFQRTADDSVYRGYVYSGLNATLPDVYTGINNYLDLDAEAVRKPPLITDALSVLNYALLPVINTPVLLKEPLYTILNSFTALVLVAWLAIRKLKRRMSRTNLQIKYQALSRTLWLGLGGSLSWLVLGHAHSLAHAHIDGIIFYLPFALFAYVAIGIWAECTVNALRLRLKPSSRV